MVVAGQDSFPDAEDKILKESDERWVHRCGLIFDNSLTKAPVKACGVSQVRHTHTQILLCFLKYKLTFQLCPCTSLKIMISS